MFRKVRLNSNEWRPLDRLSRAELAHVANSSPEDGNAVTGLPHAQLSEQARILLCAPEDCLL